MAFIGNMILRCRTRLGMRSVLQVFLNLIKNASQAQEARGTITLRYYEQHCAFSCPMARQNLPLQIEVIDDGPGFPMILPVWCLNLLCRGVKMAQG